MKKHTKFTLQDYENIGLTPDEIVMMKETIKEIRDYLGKIEKRN